MTTFAYSWSGFIADFFNWNRVKLRYCDGASFAGDGEDKVGGTIWCFLIILLLPILVLYLASKELNKKE